MGVKAENKMAYEPVNKLIIQMSAPPLISMFFQYSYNLVDSMFVAGINEQALAAVSLAFPITTLMNALGAFTVNFANMFLVRYSDTAVAFFGAYFKVQQLIFMTVNGLIQGCLPIMRFNYRAKEYGRLKQANKSGTIIATVMMIVGMLLVLIFPKEILFLFSASEEMCAFGVPAMRIMSLGFVFSGFSAMIATYEQATDSIMPGVVVQLLRQGVLLVPVIWLLNSAVQMTGIWLAFPITEFVTFLVAVVFAKIKNH